MSFSKVSLKNELNCKYGSKSIVAEMVTHDKNKNITISNSNSDKYAEEGIEMALKNNIKEALHLFGKALSFHPTNIHHYLNRCYCYLRMNMNSLALVDAEYVIHSSINNGYLFVARLRAGQASLALEKYRQAEIYLEQAIEKYPENPYAKRELMRVKITRIVSMGFREKDALRALEKYPTTLEALNYLSDEQLTFSDSPYESSSEIQYSDEDTIYSSDEDEKPNNVEIVNRMLNYKPGAKKLQHILPPYNSHVLSLSASLNKSNQTSTDPKNDDLKKYMEENSQFARTNGFVKNVKSNSITLVQNEPLKNAKNTTYWNDNAIWVGCLTDGITDEMLQEALSQFGNVLRIYRPDANTGYAFAYFENCKAVGKALKCASLNIQGDTIKISFAQRKK